MTDTPGTLEPGGAPSERLSALRWLRENPPIKVLAAYGAGAWAGLGQVDLVTGRFGAPEWLFTVAVVVSILGLVLVLCVVVLLRRRVSLRRFILVLAAASLLLVIWAFLFSTPAARPSLVSPPTQALNPVGWPASGDLLFVAVWALLIPVVLSVALVLPTSRNPTRRRLDSE